MTLERRALNNWSATFGLPKYLRFVLINKSAASKLSRMNLTLVACLFLQFRESITHIPLLCAAFVFFDVTQHTFKWLFYYLPRHLLCFVSASAHLNVTKRVLVNKYIERRPWIAARRSRTNHSIYIRLLARSAFATPHIYTHSTRRDCFSLLRSALWSAIWILFALTGCRNNKWLSEIPDRFHANRILTLFSGISRFESAAICMKWA